MNLLMLFYLLGMFDEDKLEKFNEPDISTWEYLRIIILTIISCLAVFAIAWFLIAGRIGLGQYLTF